MEYFQYTAAQLDNGEGSGYTARDHNNSATKLDGARTRQSSPHLIDGQFFQVKSYGCCCKILKLAALVLERDKRAQNRCSTCSIRSIYQA